MAFSVSSSAKDVQYHTASCCDTSRLVGDLIYLDVVTLEGNKYCITGTTKTFYVNSSSGNSLDPRPSKTAFEATTLIGVMHKISSKFKKGSKIILWRILTNLESLIIFFMLINYLFFLLGWSFSGNIGAEGICASFWKCPIPVAT